MSSSTVKVREYRTQVVRGIASIERTDWEQLVRADAIDRGEPVDRPGYLPHPFVTYEWLSALESSGCASPDTGWTPLHLLLQSADGALLGAAIVYAKDHSWGEFVFDHAWANAHERNGVSYFPKLVVAIPFTPVRGPRLLAIDAAARSVLADSVVALAQEAELSSAHLLFPQTPDQQAVASESSKAGSVAAHNDPERPTWLQRNGVQFHWTQDGWPDFDAFLAAMAQPKRKKIRAERRKVAEAGVDVRVYELAQTTLEQRDFFIDCYERTYHEHGGMPYLSRAFWHQVFTTLAQHFALVLASRHSNQLIAASLIAHDGVNAWGRYWGALERVPCLHFECCYYAPLEWAIARGLQRFEGGAQGEHKLARGLLPVATTSHHWLAHPAFASAIDRWLERERAGVDHYLDELDERSPLRAAGVTP